MVPFYIHVLLHGGDSVVVINIVSRTRDNEPRAAKAAVINHWEAQPVHGGNRV